jgi:hypothetical protein
MGRSDVDLAGLMLRCRDSGTEMLIILVRALSPRSRPDVTITAAGRTTKFLATVVPPLTAVLLPPEAAGDGHQYLTGGCGYFGRNKRPTGPHQGRHIPCGSEGGLRYADGKLPGTLAKRPGMFCRPLGLSHNVGLRFLCAPGARARFENQVEM